MTTSRRTRPKVLVASVLVSLFALLTAGAADAAVYEGKTRQDKKVKLRTAGKDPRAFSFYFRAPCQRGNEVLRADTRTFVRGRPQGFRGKSRYREELTRGFTGRIRTVVSGSRRSPRRYAGRFTVRALLVKDGEVRNRCKIEGLPWRATRN